MESLEVLAWIEGAALAVGGGFVSFWKYNEKKNKGLIDLELARIERAYGDFNELAAELKKEREEHQKTRKSRLATLSNNEVILAQINSIQDIIHCMDPMMLYACQKDPKLAMVYERYKKLVDLDNTDLGRD